MSHVFHRQAKTVPRVAASGDGVHITDTEGNKFLDASGGAAVSCLGIVIRRFCRQFAIRLTPFRLRIRVSLRQNRGRFGG